MGPKNATDPNEGATMKQKLLLAFAAFALVFSLPLAALQVPDDDPDLDATVEDIDNDGDVDADVDLDTDDVDVDVNDTDDALVQDDDADVAIDTDDELPRTASPLPLLALLGAGSLVSALGFRITRK
jgi:hypothetical protein